ncbi:terminase small subunit [Vibrio phage 1.021.C._10N.222.51.F9]|nr:terminase small subunit [Vibrio phage 1.021.A._10N.222.51.F9]AUR82115.1 terminase small subunit [Vibrio phage 1.021.B._10N.222.51.F9]AUR82165.1 terminase small subunit [Vibrio phage 1.021.C._10N.222.51.F9]
MIKVRLLDELNLPPKKACFVVEYIKDFAPRRAAEASGYSADYGYRLLEEPEVSAAIEYIIQQRLEVNMIDADWLLNEMVDNHMIARQQGNITASNTALNMVGKHKRVDAFAADKIKVSTDADVVDRLVAARRRVSEANKPQQEDDDVSFL